MKMTSEEKIFLDKVVADSGQDLLTVRNVLRAILVSILKEVYANYYNSENKNKVIIEYSIPYILKMSIGCKNILTKDDGEKTQVILDCEPSISLYKEINRIFDDKTLETEEFFKKEIAYHLMKILDFDKDTLIEE